MTAFRRTTHNFALQHAVAWANELQKPLLVLESLRCNYRWASDRHHRFVIQGMRDIAKSCSVSNAVYVGAVEPAPHHSEGLLEKIAADACVIVSDDFPCFFHPALYRAVSAKLPCSLELVDSNGLYPMRQEERVFTVAHSFRRHLQKVFFTRFPEFPEEKPLDALQRPQRHQLEEVTEAIRPLASRYGLKFGNEFIDYWVEGNLEKLPVDHQVKATTQLGGEVHASARLDAFIAKGLKSYDEDRNDPDRNATSHLSAYLHFGHLSSHQIFNAIRKTERWDESKLSKPNGKNSGFWGMSTDAEAFLDQFVVWRELGFNRCALDRKYDRYGSLPLWALQTLQEHAADHRPFVYSLEEFEEASTHDPLWNAAQRQLVSEGRIHNYLRMLWGKKILHWSKTPQDALRTMIELNNKYALDGRDPNSYSGIFWVLGRYDRAWGPEREIFGKVRYMTSESAMRKLEVRKYLQTYSGADT